MTVTHRKNRHWATLSSRINVLRLLWSKSKQDQYTLTFDKSCLSASKNAYNKILGTSQYLNPRKRSLRLAWKPDGNGNISIAEMHEVDYKIQFRVLGRVVPGKPITVDFRKVYKFEWNTPYFGGNETPNMTIKYSIK
jgi:hypothetical protein